MAFKMNVELETGIVVPDAYIRVHSLGWSREGVSSVSLRYYKDQQSSSDKPHFLEVSRNCTIVSDDTAIDWRKQAYESLKLEPEFETAIDVLEQGQS